MFSPLSLPLLAKDSSHFKLQCDQSTSDYTDPILFVSLQMTEQRKQKQRIGLLGHPPHMNINPQQPA